MRLGSDVDRLDGLSLLLEDGAGLLVRSRSDLLWETAATVWTGPSRQRVAHDLERTMALADRIAERLAALGQEARAQSDRQRRASLADRPTIDDARATLLFSDLHGDGRAAMAIGNVATATHVVVLVPGMGSDASNFAALVADARRLQYHAGLRLGGSGSVAVVAWLGYDAPAGLDEPWRAYQVLGTARAEAGGRALREFVDRLGRPDAVITLVGHSYGSLVAVDAAKRHPAVDQVVVLGSPGLGADRIGGLDLDPGTTLFAAAFPADPVARSGWFGRSPTEPRFGAVALDATPAPGEPGADITRAHSSYFEPGSRMLDSIAAVVSAEREDQRGHDGNHHRQEDDGRRHRVTDAPTGRR